MKAIRILILILCCGCSLYSYSQDSTLRKSNKDSGVAIKIDTNRIKRHDPRIATRRSLILPGWGQVYNREYWKVPIVWGALGTAAGFWIYNNTWYRRTKTAFEIVVDTATGRYGEIHPRLKSQTTGLPFDAYNLQRFRNEFRKNRDYSLLYFILLWGLNIADATVFGHLKEFDVSNDLSLKVKPNLNPMNRSAGFSLSLTAKPINSSKKVFFEAR
jgi:hypothetical protein